VWLLKLLSKPFDLRIVTYTYLVSLSNQIFVRNQQIDALTERTRILESKNAEAPARMLKLENLLDEAEQSNKNLLAELNARPTPPGQGFFCPACNTSTFPVNAGRIKMCGKCRRGPACDLTQVDPSKVLRQWWEAKERVDTLGGQKCTAELKLRDAESTINALRETNRLVEVANVVNENADLRRKVEELEAERADLQQRLQVAESVVPASRARRSVET
jgi:DNA repair exonuclease SbcCD ATPase subunit